MIKIDISIGELLDKLSILELKKHIIKDENKVIEIKKEIDILMEFENIKNENIFYYNILKWINEQIWNFTDTIKKSKIFDEEFASLSNTIFKYNQYRFRVKNMLNSKSNIKEQKSYKNDIINIKLDINSFYLNLTKINKISILYDLVVICTNDDELIKYISCIYKTSNFIFEKNNIIDCIDINQILLKEFENITIFEFPIINCISGGLLGDFIHQLSICNEIFINTGIKSNIYITDKNVEGFSFGLKVAYNDLYDILKNQIYVETFSLHNGEVCNLNLSQWRSSKLLYKNNWNYIFSNEYNIEWAKNKWIFTKEYNEKFKDIILLNISITRYVIFDFNLLSKLNKKILFICFNKSEYEKFCILSNTNFDYYVVKDLNDMFISISSCYCFLGNLSSPLTFAISMHKYCVAFIGKTVDTIHMKDLIVPNYYYYENQNSYTKNILEI